VDEADLHEIDEEVDRLIDDAVHEAQAASDPPRENLLTDVYVSY
jgi:TPP-dependent pyruvate/acetoin dehydrogenase alpha subunit